MAQPSDEHRSHRHRSERSSSHHHHRTISSTTLLLVLSLILAVLAVMLSIPSNVASQTGEGQQGGVLGYLTPKRTQQLIAREGEVARREAEVARREAELLVGAPGGVVPSPTVCPPCVVSPAETVIKEVVKEEALTPPGWWKDASTRADDILDRELKMAEREREISKREESVNRREHDASRRESWIMEQLIALGNDNPQTVEEEYIYEPAGAKRKAKALPPPFDPVYASPRTVTKTIAPETVYVPSPANTQRAATPVPEPVSPTATSGTPRTTAVEVIVEEEDPRRGYPTRRSPSRWFPGW